MISRVTLWSGLCVLLCACKSHTTIDRHSISPVVPDRDSAVVLLGRVASLSGSPDRDFVTCVGKAMQRRHPGLRVINEQAFVDAMYPWFETHTAPTDVSMLEPLFENAALRQRFDELNVDYLVWIQGRTETVDRAGSISCAVSPAGGGCFGFATWDDEADYEAAMWQVEERSSAGRIGARTTGTSYIPAVFLPIPLLARVKDAACDSMAGQLATYFAPAP